MARRLHVDKKFGDDAGHLAAVRQDARSDGTHDALGAAAIDKPKAMCGDRFSKRAASGEIGWIAAGLRTAVDADGSYWHSFLRSAFSGCDKAVAKRKIDGKIPQEQGFMM
jgi:hypothetical protein